MKAVCVISEGFEREVSGVYRCWFRESGKYCGKGKLGWGWWGGVVLEWQGGGLIDPLAVRILACWCSPLFATYEVAQQSAVVIFSMYIGRS